MKTELNFKWCISQSSLYSTTKTEMCEKTKIVEYVHKKLRNVSNIKQKYSMANVSEAATRDVL